MRLYRCLLVMALLPATQLVGQENVSAPLPAVAEVRRQVDDKQFAAALKNLARILELKGPAAAGYDRDEMLLLRAECLLQTRQTAGAKEAMEAGLKESFNAGDSVSVGKFLALGALVTRSPNMIFTPKLRTGPLAPKPINTLDRTARTDAYKALFDEMLPDVKAKVRTALQSGSMTVVLAAGRDAATLSGLEKASAGAADAEQTQRVIADVANHTDVLVNNSLNQMRLAVGRIAELANQQIMYPVQNVNPVTGTRSIVQMPRRRGLMNDEQNILRSAGTTAGQIIAATTELAIELAIPDGFKDAKAAAADLRKQAAAVLNEDYTTTPK